MRHGFTLLCMLLVTLPGYLLQGQNEVKINTNMVVESDGTVRLDGNATVWTDIMIYPDATNRTGSVPPTWTRFKKDAPNTSQGVFINMFDAGTEQELYFTVQIPHSYKVGTTLYPHVHWTTLTGTPSTGSAVTWGLEYTATAIGGTFSTTTILKGSTIIPSITPSGTSQHLITSLGTIDGTNLGISSILICRVFRAAADGTDTFPNSAGILGIDIHYEMDTEGSREEYRK